jgi:hypothetical protein
MDVETIGERRRRELDAREAMVREIARLKRRLKLPRTLNFFRDIWPLAEQALIESGQIEQLRTTKPPEGGSEGQREA